MRSIPDLDTRCRGPGQEIVSPAVPRSSGSAIAAALWRHPYTPSIEKTYGKPIRYWRKVLAGMEGKKHMAMVAALKPAYKMGHGHANALVADHRNQKRA